MTAVDRYRHSEHLSVERAGGDGVVIRDRMSGRRMRLGRPLYRFIRRFETARSLEELAPDAPAEARRFVERMVTLGFLVPADAAAREGPLTHPSLLRLFACPAAAPGSRADFTVLGVPFDGGSTVGGGARGGPAAIRQASQAVPYDVDLDTCRPRGWFDEDHGEWILRGTTLADQGDVTVRHGEGPGAVFERLAAAVARMRLSGTVPVVLGGDHSITHPVLRALGDEPLAVVHFDAHTDCSPYEPGQEHHHGNVFSRVLTLPSVTHLVQVGVRGFLSRDACAIGDGRRTGLTPSMLRRTGPRGVLDHVPADRGVYVSLDVDAIDPSSAPGTRTPRPHGLSPDEVRGVLHLVGRERRIVGFDLVEVDPERDVNGITALLAVHLILGFLGAAADGGRLAQPEGAPGEGPTPSPGMTGG